MTRKVRLAAVGEAGQRRTSAGKTNKAIREIGVGISATRILTWGVCAWCFVLSTLHSVLSKPKTLATKYKAQRSTRTHASLPLACHVLRRILSGRDQFHCRGRDADHFSGPHLARSRSEGCERYQHGRVVARAVWWTVRLSKRARA